MSLRRRLIALILLILPLSLLFGGVLTYWHALAKVETEMAAAVALGESTARDVIAALPKSADAQEQVVRLVHSFDGERHVRVSLLDKTGKEILASQVAPPTRPAPSWLQRVLTGPAHTSSLSLPPDGAQGTLRIAADPLNEIGEVWEDVALKLQIIAVFFSMLLAIYREFNRMAEGLKEAEEQNHALTQQLNAVQEEERKDLARDLHDEIGPFLFAVDVDAQTIPQYLQRGANDEVSARAAAIRQSVAHMQAHVRAILNRLRPAMLLELGLAQAVDQLIAFWKRRHPDIAITAAISQASYTEPLDEIAFRTVQEAINNAVRHGKPRHIAINASLDEKRNALVVSIADDGAGLSPAASAGFGISGMRERAAAAGGTLEVVQNVRQPGVTVVATLPLPTAASPKTADERKGTLA